MCLDRCMAPSFPISLPINLTIYYVNLSKKFTDSSLWEELAVFIFYFVLVFGKFVYLHNESWVKFVQPTFLR